MYHKVISIWYFVMINLHLAIEINSLLYLQINWLLLDNSISAAFMMRTCLQTINDEDNNVTLGCGNRRGLLYCNGPQTTTHSTLFCIRRRCCLHYTHNHIVTMLCLIVTGCIGVVFLLLCTKLFCFTAWQCLNVVIS
jgi:hypothetical protein